MGPEIWKINVWWCVLKPFVIWSLKSLNIVSLLLMSKKFCRVSIGAPHKFLDHSKQISNGKNMGLQNGGILIFFSNTWFGRLVLFLLLHSCSLASTSVHCKSLYCKSSIDTHELSWELFKMDRKWVRYELVFNGSVCSVMGDSTLLQLWIVFVYKTCKTNEKFAMNAHQFFSPTNLNLLPKWEMEAGTWIFSKDYIDFCNFCSLISISMVEQFWTQTSSCLST